MSPTLRTRLLASALLALSACSGDGQSAPDTGDTDGSGDTGVPGDTDGSGDTGVPDDTDGSGDSGGEACPEHPVWTGDAANPDCDALNDGHCMFPWPSSLYLVADPTTETSRRLRFRASAMPENFQAVRIDATPYARLDGYSVGTPIMARFARLDISSMATDHDLAPSLAADAPILLFEVAPDGSLSRVPYWVELDAQQPDTDAKTLFVRPGVILDEATRYIVAMRNLRDTDGAAIEPSYAFRMLRDGTPRCDARVADRAIAFEDIFARLSDAGVDRGSLQLAWDFNTMSSDAMHRDILSIRDQMLAKLAAESQPLTVTEVEEFTPEQNDTIAFEVRGTFRVPNYTTERTFYQGDEGVTGYVLNRDATGAVTQNTEAPWLEQPFWIRVPRSALDGTPHRLVQYGHGLLGSGDEVGAGYNGKIANDHKYIFFATNWIGMAEEDFGRTNFVVFELSRFVWLAERLQQGVVNFLGLARQMKQQAGALEALSSRGVVVDDSELYYSGISQGGIFGATYMALSTDVTRGHLGVPGQNYSTLLHRSVDFEEFFVALRGAYRTPQNIAVCLGLIQLLWDSTDPVSFYRHIKAEPFAGTPTHDVLAGPARGDYQVSPTTMEVVARSGFGIGAMANWDDEYPVSLATETPYPHVGSGIVLWRFGNAWPPPGNAPPPEDELGDPHSKPRRQANHNAQMDHFFRTGEIIDVCGGDGCQPD
jgi:hypothetical protein